MAFRTHEEEGALDTMSFDEFLIENKEATFVVRAVSDSMREAGIFSGDLLVIDKSKDPKANDIVIVVRDGTFSMKYFEDLPKGDQKVEAVVRAVVRKY